MPGTAVDISALGLTFRHRPVVSASVQLTRAHGSMHGLGEAITQSFGPEGQWCEVGNDLHTVSLDEREIRLRLNTDNASWHADHFGASWGDLSKYANVPTTRRAEVAAYVDRRQEVDDLALLQDSHLRAAAAQGGPPAVDALIRHRVELLDQWYAALGELHTALLTHTCQLPAWALRLVRQELEDFNGAREWLTSAVTAYHHGSAGERPDTLLGSLCYHFPHGAVELCTHDDRNAPDDEFDEEGARQCRPGVLSAEPFEQLGRCGSGWPVRVAGGVRCGRAAPSLQAPLRCPVGVPADVLERELTPGSGERAAAAAAPVVDGSVHLAWPRAASGSGAVGERGAVKFGGRRSELPRLVASACGQSAGQGLQGRILQLVQ